MIQIRKFGEVTQIMMKPEVSARSNYWVSAYLVDGLLIDTGCSFTAVELVKYLSERSLDLAVNTHHHEDHIGANRLLQDSFNIEILAHSQAVPLIHEPPELSLYRETAWGPALSSRVTVVPERIETDQYVFRVLETPGHCLGHVAMLEPAKGWCFSGDLFVGKRPKVASAENDITQMVRSMKMLLDYGSDGLTLFTALRTVEVHGRAALQSCIYRFQELSVKAKALHEKGLSIEEIVKMFWGGESVFGRITGGLYSSARLVCLLIDAEI